MLEFYVFCEIENIKSLNNFTRKYRKVEGKSLS